jgi:Tfp pilus assembly protein PilZ
LTVFYFRPYTIKYIQKLIGVVVEDKRRYHRFPVQERAIYYKNDPPGTNNLFMTNFSRDGMGISIPHRYNIKTGDELDLTMTITPLTQPMTVTGTVMWIKPSDRYSNYLLLCGIKFKRIDTEQKWELLDYVYDKWSKQAHEVSDSSSAEQTLQQIPTEGTKIYNTDLELYSIVESIAKTPDTISITVNDEQWSGLDRARQYTLANTLYRTLNPDIKTDHVYIRNKEGKRLAWLLQGDTGNKYMVVAGG